MKRILSAVVAILFGVALAPAALAQTSVQGGPLTGLSFDTPTNIHLAFANYPTSHGLYVYEAVKPDAGAAPSLANSTTQLWLTSETPTPTGATSIKGDVVLVVDNGHSWGADCAHQQCGIFIRLDHTATGDHSEDQFIPLTFAASTSASASPAPTSSSAAPAPTAALPSDTLVVKVNGTAYLENVPGAIYYRTPITFDVTTGSGVAATIKSYTPDLCPVTGNTVDALKGTGACDIAVTSPGDATHAPKTAHFPLMVAPATQSISTNSVSVKIGKSATLPATTAFGEKISYKASTKNCSVSGTSVKGVKIGSCALTASAPGTENYSALSAKIAVTVKR